MIAVQVSIVEDETANSVNKVTNTCLTSGMPYPIRSFGELKLLPASFKARMIRILLYSGKACQRQVPNPAIFGVANDVPFDEPIVLLVACTSAATPMDAISGFIRPSAEGP